MKKSEICYQALAHFNHPDWSSCMIIYPILLHYDVDTIVLEMIDEKIDSGICLFLFSWYEVGHKLALCQLQLPE